MIGSYNELSDMEIVDLMIGTDSEMFSKQLNTWKHGPLWWALESILRDRHGKNWMNVIEAAA